MQYIEASWNTLQVKCFRDVLQYILAYRWTKSCFPKTLSLYVAFLSVFPTGEEILASYERSPRTWALSTCGVSKYKTLYQAEIYSATMSSFYSRIHCNIYTVIATIVVSSNSSVITVIMFRWLPCHHGTACPQIADGKSRVRTRHRWQAKLKWILDRRVWTSRDFVFPSGQFWGRLLACSIVLCGRS